MNIVVAGTGYVGLVTGACLSEVGHNVTCVDIDRQKVELMKQGISPIYEPGLDELLERNYKENRLNFTVDYKNAYKNADIVFIGVGIPERADGSANLDYVFGVCKQIAENVTKDCLVVVKSTVPIGTNDKVEEFTINIIKINNNDAVTKNILFEVTDKNLLDLTGGIVQGMSGSPIIQGDYIIGAVTHVVVDDPTKGYGIFITKMLEEAEN